MGISQTDGKMEGWLYLIRFNRIGLQYSRERYFVLKDNCLRCYKTMPISEKEVFLLFVCFVLLFFFFFFNDINGILILFCQNFWTHFVDIHYDFVSSFFFLISFSIYIYIFFFLCFWWDQWIGSFIFMYEHC